MWTILKRLNIHAVRRFFTVDLSPTTSAIPLCPPHLLQLLLAVSLPVLVGTGVNVLSSLCRWFSESLFANGRSLLRKPDAPPSLCERCWKISALSSSKAVTTWSCAPYATEWRGRKRRTTTRPTTSGRWASFWSSTGDYSLDFALDLRFQQLYPPSAKESMPRYTLCFKLNCLNGWKSARNLPAFFRRAALQEANAQSEILAPFATIVNLLNNFAFLSVVSTIPFALKSPIKSQDPNGRETEEANAVLDADPTGRWTSCEACSGGKWKCSISICETEQARLQSEWLNSGKLVFSLCDKECSRRRLWSMIFS